MLESNVCCLLKPTVFCATVEVTATQSALRGPCPPQPCPSPRVCRGPLPCFGWALSLESQRSGSTPESPVGLDQKLQARAWTLLRPCWDLGRGEASVKEDSTCRPLLCVVCRPGSLSSKALWPPGWLAPGGGEDLHQGARCSNRPLPHPLWLSYSSTPRASSAWEDLGWEAS